MAMTSKDVPAELRRAAEAFNSGSAHADLRNYQPVAGPSTSSQGFRTGTAGSNQQANLGQDAFNDFDNSFASPVPGSGQDSVSFTSSRLQFTEEDLRPRPEDSAEVMALFHEQDDSDTLTAVTEEVSARQSLPWHDKQDSVIPKDPLPAHVIHSPEATYTSADYPFLFDLLSLPEDESMSSYLREHTYTDDVWGLPMAIKQDLDTLKSANTNDSAREKALRRLGMLKNHLIAKDFSALEQAPTRLSNRIMTDADWEQIWTRQV